MQTTEERIAVLEVEFRNMSGNLEDIRKNVAGINTTLSGIAITMAEGRGAIKLGTWVTKTCNWLFCILSGIAGGVIAQKSIVVADKFVK